MCACVYYCAQVFRSASGAFSPRAVHTHVCVHMYVYHTSCKEECALHVSSPCSSSCLSHCVYGMRICVWVFRCMCVCVCVSCVCMSMFHDRLLLQSIVPHIDYYHILVHDFSLGLFMLGTNFAVAL